MSATSSSGQPLKQRSWDSAEASTEIRMAIESLPVNIRQVVVLYYIEQFAIKEIKQILKIPEGTVKSRLSKGRELMKNY